MGLSRAAVFGHHRPVRLPFLAATLLLALACVPRHADLPARGTSTLAKADKAYARGDLEKAESLYGRAIETGGADAADARYLRARVRVERGDLAGAEADVVDVLAGAPKHWEAICLLGLIREKQGRRADALEAFRRAAAIAPRELVPRNNLAFLTLQDGRVQEAYDLLVKLVEEFPDSARAWTNLALAAERLGRAEEAARARETAQRLADAEAQEPEGSP